MPVYVSPLHQMALGGYVEVVLHPLDREHAPNDPNLTVVFSLDQERGKYTARKMKRMR